jgi:hypothetical protein
MTEDTEDFILRVPKVEGQTRAQLYLDIALFLDTAYRADVLGDPEKARWPRHSWGTPIGYVFLRDPKEDP